MANGFSTDQTEYRHAEGDKLRYRKKLEKIRLKVLKAYPDCTNAATKFRKQLDFTPYLMADTFFATFKRSKHKLHNYKKEFCSKS